MCGALCGRAIKKILRPVLGSSNERIVAAALDEIFARVSSSDEITAILRDWVAQTVYCMNANMLNPALLQVHKNNIIFLTYPLFSPLSPSLLSPSLLLLSSSLYYPVFSRISRPLFSHCLPLLSSPLLSTPLLSPSSLALFSLNLSSLSALIYPLPPPGLSSSQHLPTAAYPTKISGVAAIQTTVALLRNACAVFGTASPTCRRLRLEIIVSNCVGV